MAFFVAMSSPCAPGPSSHAHTRGRRRALLPARAAKKSARASLVIHKSGTPGWLETPKGGDPAHLDREPSCREPPAGFVACVPERTGQRLLRTGPCCPGSSAAPVRKREPSTHNAVDSQTSLCIIRLRRNGKSSRICRIYCFEPPLARTSRQPCASSGECVFGPTQVLGAREHVPARQPIVDGRWRLALVGCSWTSAILIRSSNNCCVRQGARWIRVTRKRLGRCAARRRNGPWLR
jgi:hypothetical protein